MSAFFHRGSRLLPTEIHWKLLDATLIGNLMLPVALRRESGSTQLLIFTLVAPYMPQSGSILYRLSHAQLFIFMKEYLYTPLLINQLNLI